MPNDLSPTTHLYYINYKETIYSELNRIWQSSMPLASSPLSILKNIGFSEATATIIQSHYMVEMECSLQEAVNEYINVNFESKSYDMPTMLDCDKYDISEELAALAIKEHQIALDWDYYQTTATSYKDVVTHKLNNLSAKVLSTNAIYIKVQKDVTKKSVEYIQNLAKQLETELSQSNKFTLVFHAHTRDLNKFGPDYMPVTRYFGKITDDYGYGMYLNENIVRAIEWAIKCLGQSNEAFLKIYRIKTSDLPNPISKEASLAIIKNHRVKLYHDVQDIQSKQIIRGPLGRLVNGQWITSDDLQLRVCSCTLFREKFEFVNQVKFTRDTL